MEYYDAHIRAIRVADGCTLESEYIKNVGSMDNTKRRAKCMADKLELAPTTRDWKTETTEYTEESGLSGGWESEAERQYTDADGNTVLVRISRA